MTTCPTWCTGHTDPYDDVDLHTSDELDRPERARRRNGAKSDPLDAIRAARKRRPAPGGTPRSAGDRQALSVLPAARRPSRTTRSARSRECAGSRFSRRRIRWRRTRR